MLTGVFVPLKAFAEPDNICDDTSIPEELREAAGCRTDEERNGDDYADRDGGDPGGFGGDWTCGGDYLGLWGDYIYDKYW